MYDAALLQLSSSTYHKTLFDADPNQKAAYYLPISIEEEFLVEAPDLYWDDFDWGALFSVITSLQWHGALYDLRRGKDRETAINSMIAVISKQLTEFNITNEKGRVRVTSKAVSDYVSYSGLAGVAVGGAATLFGVGVIPAAALAGSVLSGAKHLPAALKMVIPGYRKAHELSVERHARLALVPRIGVMGPTNR